MSRYLIIINFRTLITMALSLLVPFIAYQFKVVYNIDLTLMSIAIIFPLVFTIRGAFRRREKALEHLFKPFQGGARKGGSGLGLAIAAELVRGKTGRLTGNLVQMMTVKH